jgi:hypothetical protein
MIKLLREFGLAGGTEMQGKMLKVITGIIVVMLVGVAVLPGCGKSGPSGEPEYAGAIAENILQAINSGDYAPYSEHFDDQMRKAIPEDLFQKSRELIRGKIGDYISKEFVEKQVVQEIYTVVIYKAKFSEEPADVKVTVTFLETDTGVFVSGLSFVSPKLQGQ